MSWNVAWWEAERWVGSGRGQGSRQSLAGSGFMALGLPGTGSEGTASPALLPSPWPPLGRGSLEGKFSPNLTPRRAKLVHLCPGESNKVYPGGLSGDTGPAALELEAAGWVEGGRRMGLWDEGAGPGQYQAHLKRIAG